MPAKREPSRRDGMIGTDRRAIDQSDELTRDNDQTVPLRDGILVGPVPGNKLPGYDHQSLRDKLNDPHG
jgi:hypothetical protein